jgi:hypothetical protein
MREVYWRDMSLFAKICILIILSVSSIVFAQKSDSAYYAGKPDYIRKEVNNIYLNSAPQDAYVYKNDSLVGHTPLFLDSRIGIIRLEKPGYKAVDFNPRLNKNNALVELKFEYPVNEENFYRKPVFKIITGSVVVLGAVSAYFKLKADRHYENYRNSGSRSELNSTRKYDLISGLSFGALQINLGILIYHFLKD